MGLPDIKIQTSHFSFQIRREDNGKPPLLYDSSRCRQGGAAAFSRPRAPEASPRRVSIAWEPLANADCLAPPPLT